jgi:hypothetical protein
MIANAIVARWRDFWFREGSLVDLACARIVLVLLVLYLDADGRCLRVAIVSPDHWKPIALLQALGIGRPDWTQLVWLDGATRVALIAAGVGLMTNVALAIAFVLQLVQEALVNSAGKVTHATIPLLYAMLFLSVAPIGKRLSVDAAIARHGRILPVSRDARWPLELILVEIAAFYAQAGYAKLRAGGLAWADGYTLQYYLLEKGTPVGMWLAEHLWACAALSMAVLVFELGFPLAVVLRRLRPWFFAGGCVFHLGTTLALDISFWPLVALYLVFVPWRRLLGRLPPIATVAARA